MTFLQKPTFPQQRIPIRANELDQISRIRLRNADLFRRTSGKQLLIALFHTSIAILFIGSSFGPTYRMIFGFKEQPAAPFTAAAGRP
ncbi:hypothetical protein [Mesorhizobium sp. M7A.F.Ca.US.008.03.1.1]|uniref:hypothetical protein n=1 Tax=Mesorhizobium sp. M7A.F.Ca.US.008.03.1.1 TaxID=2496742 RepID=UPI0013DF0A97|nr:hypothetical protein [Mesorhizobium sp. M7A.F.Ca.US.008.03.1.1]